MSNPDPAIPNPQASKRDAALHDLPARGKWAVYFSATGKVRVNELASDVSQTLEIRSIKPKVAGLGLLQISDSVRQDGFHLGEFSLSRALIELTDSFGNTSLGAAIIAEDDEQLAIDLAILDAVLAASWPGSEKAADLLRQGEAACSDRDKLRKKMLSSTAVDFSTLEEEL